MKHLGVYCCVGLVLMLFLQISASMGEAAERVYTAEAVYNMSAAETRTQAEEAVRKIALRKVTEEVALYITERSESNKAFLSEDDIYVFAGQVLQLKQEDYDWQVDSQTGVLTVNATIVAVLDEKTVDAKLLEKVHEHRQVEYQASESKASAQPEIDEEIALLMEMDRKHHFTATQWYRQARSLFQLEAYAAVIYACERAIALEPKHYDARNLWVQAHKKSGKAATSAQK